jgi:hypothetical protein
MSGGKYPKECSLTITSIFSGVNGYDLSGFLDKHTDTTFMKVRLDAFSVGFTNSGLNDFLTVSVKVNAFDPTAYGAERDLLYKVCAFVPAGASGTANNLLSSDTYMIVNKLDLYKLLRVDFVGGVVGSGTITINSVYAKLTIMPYYQ